MVQQKTRMLLQGLGCYFFASCGPSYDVPVSTECYGSLKTNFMDENIILTGDNLSYLSEYDDLDCDNVAMEDDCDDQDSSLLEKAKDFDCDGTQTAEDCDDSDPDLNQDDADFDGWSTCGGDCDDRDSTIHPSAEEVLGDNIDQNCNGIHDETPFAFDFMYVNQITCKCSAYKFVNSSNVGDCIIL